MLIKSYQVNTDIKKTPINNEQTRTNKENKLTESRKNESSVVFAGDLNLSQDNIALHNIQAQRKALKLVLDTYKGDEGLDDNVRILENSVKSYDEEVLMNINERKHIEELRGGLEEQYGISKDSKEYEDLKLIRREKELSKEGRINELTDQEKKRLASIGDLTSYQKQSLEYDSMIGEYQNRADSANMARSAVKTVITDIKIDRLKSDPMVSASKSAEEIISDAAKEAAGMYMGEVKDNVDKQMEQMGETIDKLQEKEKEEEAKKAEIKDNEEKNNETLGSKNVESGSAAAGSSSDKVRIDGQNYKSFYNVIEELGLMKKMIDEDMKGIAVDKLL